MDEQPRHGLPPSRTEKHAIASLVQRLEQRTFNPRGTGSNPVGGTMHGTSPCVSASIYYRIGCGNFFFRPRAKQGEGKHTSATNQGRAYNPDPITVRRTAPL